ncbi:efflux RND transporter periplasmic adaptor subunit [Jiangella ureilytica]|uniref:Efflux RND transporter periplasmic adaptor subunit n=1 Tax=Jiangella ureilytica TaxID=2530374 RepID=A0A4R4RAX0_9ACTN|nr:peptidoglycan-binding protein [Jiangella ureilytica]TDC46150.1 efflux RND transporter periplasmic adaptor subunit [Jiangella ureilytica]
MTATLDQQERGRDDIDAELDRPRRARTRLLWLTLGVVGVAGAGGAAWYLTQEDAGEPASEAAAPVATATVARETIAAAETWSGTLGHGDALTVTAGQNTGTAGQGADPAGQGTVTRVAAVDTEVTRGTELYRLDERPVTALLGVIPMYRDLGSGDYGVDVEQLEANLAALGYTGFTADDEYTDNTAEAVEEWQEDLGRDETGRVGRGDVAFLPEGGRVGTVYAEVGTPVTPGTPVLDVTGTDQVATLEVDVADRDLLAVGTAVTVVLPDGAEAAGTVTAATVAEAPPASGGSGAAGAAADEEAASAEDAVVEVEVTLAAPVDAALAGSPVDVVLPVGERADVLVVPVTALLALAGGGYGLELVGPGGTTSVVPVEPGLFADGRVEVTGDGIAEGDVVGVAGR